MRFKLAAMALLVSSVTNAQSVNTILEAQFTDNDNIETKQFGVLHYFQGRETRGPLDQFSFINSNSYIQASYADADLAEGYSVGGEWHAGNGLFLGAGYFRTELNRNFLTDTDTDSYTATIGYQASEQWSISTTLLDVEDQDTVALFDVQYEHDLGNNDFLAFSYGTNDDTDFHRFGMQYFNTLENGQYVILKADYTDFDGGDESWTVGADWYFNQQTSVFANIGDEDSWQAGAQHYFNDNWALSAFRSNSNLSSDASWGVSLRAQF